MDLAFIRKYVRKDGTVDLDLLQQDPSFLRLLGSVWSDGYGCGADDIIEDVTVEQAHVNPYI